MRQPLDSKSFLYFSEVVFKCGQAARKYWSIDHSVNPAATSSKPYPTKTQKLKSEGLANKITSANICAAVFHLPMLETAT